MTWVLGPISLRIAASSPTPTMWPCLIATACAMDLSGARKKESSILIRGRYSAAQLRIAFSLEIMVRGSAPGSLHSSLVYCRVMNRLSLAITILIISSVASAQNPRPDFGPAQDEALKLLVHLVKIDTSDPPGNESQAARYIQEVLQREGIDAEIVEPVAGRSSVIARLKGNGNKKPLLIMGHTDVVPVDRSHWTVEPFAGEIRDGILYGRGVLDDKSFVASNMEILLLLHRLRIPLSRDVIFLAEASEEASS